MKLKIGTRGSNLAVLQANIVKDALADLFQEIEIIKLKTSGDIIRSNLAQVGGKGLFLKELEIALLEKKIDIAVHSMKDVPAFIDERLVIPSVLKRGDPRDVFISKKYHRLSDVPKNAIIGTSAVRRKVFLKDIAKTINIRGNVESRIAKQDVLDGVILSYIALQRLNLTQYIKEILPESVMIPSPGQGTICIQCRSLDYELIDILSSIRDNETWICNIAERAFMQRINGDCTTPMACYAKMTERNTIVLNAMLYTNTNLKKVSSLECPILESEAMLIGEKLADILLH